MNHLQEQKELDQVDQAAPPSIHANQSHRYLSTLTKVCVQLIFQILDCTSLLHTAQTSKQFYAAAANKFAWQHHALKLFVPHTFIHLRHPSLARAFAPIRFECFTPTWNELKELLLIGVLRELRIVNLKEDLIQPFCTILATEPIRSNLRRLTLGTGNSQFSMQTCPGLLNTLASLPILERLDIRASFILDSNLNELFPSTSLRSISLSQTHPPFTRLEPLGDLPHLTAFSYQALHQEVQFPHFEVSRSDQRAIVSKLFTSTNFQLLQALTLARIDFRKEDDEEANGWDLEGMFSGLTHLRTLALINCWSCFEPILASVSSPKLSTIAVICATIAQYPQRSHLEEWHALAPSTVTRLSLNEAPGKHTTLTDSLKEIAERIVIVNEDPSQRIEFQTNWKEGVPALLPV